MDKLDKKALSGRSVPLISATLIDAVNEILTTIDKLEARLDGISKETVPSKTRSKASPKS